MRLVSAVLFVALTGAASLAQEAKPADPKPEVTKKKVPYRVVKMLPETGQVLLFDRTQGTHVVAEVGQALDGYLVDEIDEDEVTLIGPGGAQVILTSPPPPRVAKRTSAKKPLPADPYAESSTEPGADDPVDDPVDASASPTGDAPRVASAAGHPDPTSPTGVARPAPVAHAASPIDPYAEPAAPVTPGEGGVRVASAADPATASTATAPASSAAGVSPVPARTSPPPPPIVDADPSASTRTAPPPPPMVEATADDPYGDPGIAAFADAVRAPAAPDAGAKAAPTKHGKATKPVKAAKGARAGGGASSEDAASALASAATGAAVPPAQAAAEPPRTIAGAPAADVSVAGGPKTSAITIPRSEVDAALADFGKLAASFQATFTPDGLRFDAVREGTLLAKMGLRKGDVITYVDGQPLRSLDDAATLYARAGAIRSTTLQVVRDGKLVTMRVAIQ